MGRAELTQKYGYVPMQRWQTDAVNRPMSRRQRLFIARLWEDKPEMKAELLLLLALWHGIDFEHWASADAQFAINCLLYGIPDAP